MASFRTLRPRQPRASTGKWLLLVALSVGLLSAVLQVRTSEVPVVWQDVPQQVIGSGFTGSQVCQNCHEAEHQSWRASFHRSMTQRPSQQTVLAPWKNQTVAVNGKTLQLFMKGNEFWLTMPDPDATAVRRHQAPDSDAHQPALLTAMVERQIVMTTGSHHYQAYWVRGMRGNELWQVPFVYHLAEQRFLPRESVFLQPPEEPQHSPRWNSNCIQCHAVAGQPRHDELSDSFETEVTELGISCEACHGPGLEHVEVRSTWQQWVGIAAEPFKDTSIVNPGKLNAQESSEICGQCHSYFLPSDPDSWWATGFVGHQPPRQPLEQARRILDFERDSQDASLGLSAHLNSIFFPDGSIRVGGREYNGLLKSKCYSEGTGDRQLGCLSCHEMHGESPVGQLRTIALNNDVCSNCHKSIALQLPKHTHHATASSGSQCVNCHMPHTSYALLRGLRSHRITKPSALKTDELGIPNACNLCHLDQTLAWTANKLQQWYGHELPIVSSNSTPQVVVEALSAEAGTRALAVHALAWKPALQATHQEFQPLVLAETLNDPYAAIRQMAWRSLRSYDGFDALSFDFIAPLAERQLSQLRISAQARLRFGTPPPWLTASQLHQLANTRDNKAVRISE